MDISVSLLDGETNERSFVRVVILGLLFVERTKDLAWPPDMEQVISCRGYLVRLGGFSMPRTRELRAGPRLGSLMREKSQREETGQLEPLETSSLVRRPSYSNEIRRIPC